MARISSLSEKPISYRSRRLADWLNPTGARKIHSLVDKVYKPASKLYGGLGLVNLVSLIPSLARGR